MTAISRERGLDNKRMAWTEDTAEGYAPIVGLLAWLFTWAVTVLMAAVVLPALSSMHGWAVFSDFSSMLLKSSDAAYQGLGHIYTGRGEILVALPGFEELMTGIWRLLETFHVFASVTFAHVDGHTGMPGFVGIGSQIVIVVAYGLGTSAIVPLDGLARDLGLGQCARLAFNLFACLALAWTVALWGHPDDAMAVGLMTWALREALRGRSRRAAWLLGAGLAVQPLVVLGAFVVAAYARPRGLKGWWSFAWRVSAVPVLSLVVPLAVEPSLTIRHVIGQPVEWGSALLDNHPTPWSSLTLHQQVLHLAYGRVAHIAYGSESRLLAVALAACIAIWLLHRHEQHPGELAPWLLAIAFSGRIAFESVVIPYYLFAPLVFALLGIAQWRPRWLALGVPLAAAVAYGSYERSLGEWGYFAAMVVGLALLCALSAPRMERGVTTHRDFGLPELQASEGPEDMTGVSALPSGTETVCSAHA